MTKEFKKTFFTCLLVVLLIISNLIGLKLTNFLNLTIAVDFLTYPFTFLCTLLLLNLGGKKCAYQGILVSALIQIFITISYTLAIKLGNQSIIPDLSVYVNELFKVNELRLLASIIAFLVSHYVLIYIYDNLKKFGKELYGIVLGLLGAMFLNSTIFLVITLNDQDPLMVVNMLLSNVIISIIMLVCITVIFYLLKEKDQEVVEINKMSININNHFDEDKAIADLVVEKKPTKNKTKTNSKRSNNNSKSTTRKNTNKNTSNKKTTTTTKKQKSKAEVNKTSK